MSSSMPLRPQKPQSAAAPEACSQTLPYGQVLASAARTKLGQPPAPRPAQSQPPALLPASDTPAPPSLSDFCWDDNTEARPFTHGALFDTVLGESPLDEPAPSSGPALPSDLALFGEAPTVYVSATEDAPQEDLFWRPGQTGSLPRSTVLPRLELVDNEPRLVNDDRRRYEHLAQVGQGGVGEVLKALDNDIGRTVAIKRLLPGMRGAPILVRFTQEIRTIGQLEHPNIVPIHDVGVDEQGEYYFVMKYVEGETLEAIIEKLAAGDRLYHERFPFEMRVAIFEQILEAVHYAHCQGIIHRDIKPSNIMVGRYGEVVVMDWGIAKRIRKSVSTLDQPEIAVESLAASTDQEPAPDPFETRLGTLVGTPAYMSPEQARGEALDERSDIYSLSVLFHELLCLKHYLSDKGSMKEVLAGVIFDPVPMPGFISSPHQRPTPMDLGWFVKKGLAKDPSERYQSVAEMLERLRLRRQGKIPIQCHITLLKRVSNEWTRLLDRYPIWVTGAMVGLLGAVAWLVWGKL